MYELFLLLWIINIAMYIQFVFLRIPDWNMKNEFKLYR